MIYLLLTSITVSIDSLFCGFSLAKKNTNRNLIILSITFIVFIMCLITNFSAMLLSNYITEKTSCIGGIILIFVGLINLLKHKDENSQTNNFKQILLTGFAVGLDGAIANLSLAIMGFNGIEIPIILSSMHGVMISLGVLFSTTSFGKLLEKNDYIPPLILILLGIYKIIGLFL